MSRIRPLTRETATADQAQALAKIEAKMGRVPNVLATLAHSPAALGTYLAATAAIAEGSLDAKARERVALAIATANQCDYCASAHTQIGRQAGLTSEEIEQALHAQADDPKTQALLRFADAVVTERGKVSDATLNAFKAAGWSDGAVFEVVALVALNTLTNYANHIAETAIDFPAVLAPAHAQAA